MLRANDYFCSKAEHYDSSIKRNYWWKRIKALEERRLLGLIPRIDGLSFLDLGSGTGYYAERLQRQGGQVLCVDKSLAMVQVLKQKRLTSIQGSIESLNLGLKFDVIVAAGSFEFIEDIDQAFKTVKAHLKSDGVFILLYPRGGLVGLCYGLVHRLWNCPTYHCNVSHLIRTAMVNNLFIFKQSPASILSSLFMFKNKHEG